MRSDKLKNLLQRHPHLKDLLSSGDFLTGYTDGSLNGQTVSVFVFRCNWQHFCVQAKAIDPLLAGEVLVVTDYSVANASNNWKAYSLKEEKSLSPKKVASNSAYKSLSNLTSFAV